MPAKPITQQKNTYYQLSNDGFFTTKSNEQDPEAHKRIKKDLSEVWERRYGAIYGYLVAIRNKSIEYGGATIKMVELYFVEKIGDENYDVLSLNENASNLNRILMRLPLVNFEKPVELQVYKYHDKAKGVDKTYVDVWQDEQKVLPKYTKDHMGNCPEWQKVKVRGKEEWDNYDQLMYLLQEVKVELEKAHVGEAPKPTVSDVTEAHDEDLPF
jgi:hypothetical protein